MGVIPMIAGVVLIVTAALQAADALGRIGVRFYPFLKSQSSALKWAYVCYLVILGVVLIIMGAVVRW